MTKHCLFQVCTLLAACTRDAPIRSRGPSSARTETPCPAFVGAPVPDVPLPQIDLLPDPTWDAAAEPIEPHYDLAFAYGVGDWREACLERGRPRGGDAEELLRYLLVWCGAERNGAPATRDALLAFSGARTRRLADAVRADAIALLGEIAADDAMTWLAEQNLPLFEELAVRYHALGRDHDAATVLLALVDRGERVTSLVHCRRMQRQVALHLLRAPTPDLVALANVDPGCAKIVAALRCPAAAGQWAPVTTPCDAHCAAEAAWTDLLGCHIADNVDPKLRIEVGLASARMHWPAERGTSAGWKELARVSAQIDDPISKALEQAAMENASHVADIERCERARWVR